jgi:hypothetical protein
MPAILVPKVTVVEVKSEHSAVKLETQVIFIQFNVGFRPYSKEHISLLLEQLVSSLKENAVLEATALKL